MLRLNSVLVVCLASMLICSFTSKVNAGVIKAGEYDYWSTPLGGGLIPKDSVLNDADGNPALLPNGDPFVVPFDIPMVGDPQIGSGNGNTDTIAKRTTGLVAGSQPPGDIGTGIIEVELVALQLKSIDPVDIGGSLFDVFVKLDNRTPSLGEINILTHEDDANNAEIGGGKFDSFFDVFAKVSFESLSGGQTLEDLYFNDRIESSNTSWSHQAPLLYPAPDNTFHIGEILHVGPHPKVVSATVPEPGAIAIWGVLASVGLIGRRRRRRAKA